MIFLSVLDMEIKRRLERVTFPGSRALKWSCPDLFFKIFPLLVILNRFAVALWVFNDIVVY